MKEFFGIDVTENKQNECFNCAPFQTHQVPGSLAEALDTSTAALQAQGKKAELPPVFRVLYLILLLATVSVVGGLLRGLGNVGLKQAYHNAGWIFYLAGGLIVAMAAMALWKRTRASKATSGEDFQATTRRHAAALESCYAALGVPGGAPAVDVMGCKYRMKNGKVKLVTNGYFQYINPEMRLFAEDGCLCLADARDRYAIPLSEIRAVRRINKSASLLAWNKEDHFDFGRYADYKISGNDYGNITVKPYYAVEILHGGEEYVLHFPCYELPLFQPLLDLPITE